jgi:hypothetical protein
MYCRLHECELSISPFRIHPFWMIFSKWSNRFHSRLLNLWQIQIASLLVHTFIYLDQTCSPMPTSILMSLGDLLLPGGVLILIAGVSNIDAFPSTILRSVLRTSTIFHYNRYQEVVSTARRNEVRLSFLPLSTTNCVCIISVLTRQCKISGSESGVRIEAWL